MISTIEEGEEEGYPDALLEVEVHHNEQNSRSFKGKASCLLQTFKHMHLINLVSRQTFVTCFLCLQFTLYSLSFEKSCFIK